MASNTRRGASPPPDFPHSPLTLEELQEIANRPGIQEHVISKILQSENSDELLMNEPTKELLLNLLDDFIVTPQEP